MDTAIIATKNIISEDSNDSDYEVEVQIKPEKVTKNLNIPVDDEDYIVKKVKNKDVFDSSKPEKEHKPKPKRDEKSPDLKQTLDIKDLNKQGIMKKGQTRYVLYVNNIPYDVNKDNIKQHFAKACQLKDVRIPTDKTTKKPKGFCYIELTSEEEYQVRFSLKLLTKNTRAEYLFL